MTEIVFHSFEVLPSAEGGHVSLLLRTSGGPGIVVWAGLLRAEALARRAEDLTETDYLALDTARFTSCNDVWARFRGPRFAALVTDLRHRIALQQSLGGSPPGMRDEDQLVRVVRTGRWDLRRWLRAFTAVRRPSMPAPRMRAAR